MDYLLRYGEIGTKSEITRERFEKILVENIEIFLKKKGFRYNNVKRIRGRIIVYGTDKGIKFDKIFGIVSYSTVKKIEVDIEVMKREAMNFIGKNKTFRISASRLDKKFPKTSLEVNKIVGEYIVLNSKCEVDLIKPDINIYIEILKNEAFIFDSKDTGAGGLPIGTSDYVLCLGGESAGEACLMIMKRGAVPLYESLRENERKKVEEYLFCRDYFGKNGEGKILGLGSFSAVVSPTKDIEKIAKLKREYNCPIFTPLIGL